MTRMDDNTQVSYKIITDRWEMEVTPRRGSIDLDISYGFGDGCSVNSLTGDESIGAMLSTQSARALASALYTAADDADAEVERYDD